SPPETPTEGTTRDRLRELRERAQASLVKQRERMREMESRFSTRLEAVAVEIASELASDSLRSANLQAEHDIEQQRSEWEAELQQTDAELNRRMDELNAKLVELVDREQQLDARQAQVDELEQGCRQQQDEIAARQAS